MPKETFWDSATAVEDDGASEPVLTITWGETEPGTYINGVLFDQSGIDRMQSVLRRATGKDRTVTVTLQAQTSGYVEGMESAAAATRALTTELRKAGITPDKMPDAVLTALKLSAKTE